MYPALMAEIAARGWTQGNLAEAIGMNESQMSLLLRGKRRVRIDTAFEIQRALNTEKTIDELFQWRER